jgi:hypothetical protein
MFVDADILFLRSVHEMFHRDYGAPLAMLGTFITPERNVIHQGFSTTAICADFGLSRYLWTNSGLFMFKNDQAKQIFKECYDFYISGIKKHPQYMRGNLPDELVFGIVGAAHPVGFIGSPRPMPDPEDIPLMTPTDSKWPLIHLIGRPSDEFMDHLVSEMARRRRERGFPVVSEKIWRQKAHPTPTIWQKAVHKCKTTARKLRRAG